MLAEKDVSSNVTKGQVLGSEMILWTKLVRPCTFFLRKLPYRTSSKICPQIWVFNPLDPPFCMDVIYGSKPPN